MRFGIDDRIWDEPNYGVSVGRVSVGRLIGLPGVIDRQVQVDRLSHSLGFRRPRFSNAGRRRYVDVSS
jgi:hypothetical protein